MAPTSSLSNLLIRTSKQLASRPFVKCYRRPVIEPGGCALRWVLTCIFTTYVQWFPLIYLD